MNILKLEVSRRRFLQATGTVGAVGAVGLAGTKLAGFSTLSEAQAAAPGASAETVITKNVCAQCPARCGIDVYTTNGKVHAIYGSYDHPISNGKLCPKGHLGTYLLYDPDRFKGPMKRTNPKKGRNEDPKFVPISWDEAFKTVADRLNVLRDKGESHRFAFLFGRGWGPTDVGLYGPFGAMYGTPNAPIGHSSMCADASKLAREAQEGFYDYHSYDYKNTNYLLNFGASYLEAFRPYNYLMQMWGHMRTKSPQTRVTTVEVRLSTTAAASDRALFVKPGTDAALALAIAHVMLTEGLWNKNFVGDFADGANHFKVGMTVAAAAAEAAKAAKAAAAAAPAVAATAAAAAPVKGKGAKTVVLPTPPGAFNEKWTLGLVEWWDTVVKSATPKWAADITGVAAKDIVTVAREFGTTRPAMVIQERGPGSHSNGTYNCMAVNALNALVGANFAEGGVMHHSGAPYGKLPVDYNEFKDDYAKSDDRKKPRIDLVKGPDLPLAKNGMQDIAKNHLAGKPYKLDTMLFNMTNPIFTAPDCKVWEEALKDIFIIGTSPYPDETNMYADLVLPEHTYLERLQVCADQPIHGYPQAHLRTPAIKPLYDTRDFADIIIEIGKRMKGPMAEYYKALGNHENLVRALAKGFEAKPGSNGVNSFESWKQKGVWFKTPYAFRQIRGEFFEWDGKAYAKPMTEADVKYKLFKTISGKFEFNSNLLRGNVMGKKKAPDGSYMKTADGKDVMELQKKDTDAFINKKLGVTLEQTGFPQYIPAKYTGGGDLHFITPKTAMNAEGRSANIPHAIALQQPSVGGRTTVYLEINPQTAKAKGIRNNDKVRIKSALGTIEAYARLTEGARPDTLVLPFAHGHWAQGRWAKGRGPGHSGEITANQSDPLSGLASYYTGMVSIEKA